MPAVNTSQGYLQHAGLGAWEGFITQHLPDKCVSIAVLRTTNTNDMRRLGKNANMKLDVKTTKQVLGALQKQVRPLSDPHTFALRAHRDLIGRLGFFVSLACRVRSHVCSA